MSGRPLHSSVVISGTPPPVVRPLKGNRKTLNIGTYIWSFPGILGEQGDEIECPLRRLQTLLLPTGPSVPFMSGPSCLEA